MCVSLCERYKKLCVSTFAHAYMNDNIHVHVHVHVHVCVYLLVNNYTCIYVHAVEVVV